MKAFMFFALVALVAARTLEADEEDKEVEREIQGGYDSMVTDPCSKKQCGPGKECDLNEEGSAVCICAHTCPEENEARAKVCSSQNETFSNECEMYRQQCLCRRRQAGCITQEYRHMELDYFGECQEFEPCTDYEMQEFPKRMRRWLYLVMEELADRRELSRKEIKFARKAKKDDKQWVIPVIWKFCDLDTSSDRMVSAREIRAITAPLKPLEHCTGPFVDKCDDNEDGEITLEEWGLCLGLDEGDIEDICDSVVG